MIENETRIVVNFLSVMTNNQTKWGVIYKKIAMNE